MSYIPLSPGGVFNRLTVIRRAGTRRKLAAWECRCSCGNVGVYVGRDLRIGKSKSCGCLSAERRLAARANRVSDMEEYETWAGMWQRCTNRNVKKYYMYGGRGISVCERLADVGTRPSKAHSLDRFPDKNGNYEPGNVRWATQKEQCRNTRKNRIVTMRGMSLCLAEWCERLGLNYYTINGRVFRGMDPVAALTKPLRRWPSQTKAA